MSDMRYVPLGESELEVSVVGVGCNAFGTRIDEEQTASVVRAAVDAGITLFDTADVYGNGQSEELLGRALGSRRDDVLVATKFGMDLSGEDRLGGHGTRAYVRQAVEASLRRLGTDRIDLYQLHRPDPLTPIEETLGALSELVHEGKVRFIGSSNLAAWQVVDADWVSRTAGLERFVSAQNEYSLYNRLAEDELVPACEAVGAGLLPYFPLAYGLLTGKYRRGEAAPEGSRLAGSEPGLPARGRELGPDRGARGVRRRARRLDAHPRDRWPGGPTGCGQRDLGRDAARAGRGQRRGGCVGAERGRPRGSRGAPRALGLLVHDLRVGRRPPRGRHAGAASCSPARPLHEEWSRERAGSGPLPVRPPVGYRR